MKVKISLSSAVRGSEVSVKVLPKKVIVGIKGQPATFDGQLDGEVENEDITWQLEDGGKTVVVNMEKSRGGWWNKFLATEERIKTKFPKMTDNQMDSFMR